MLCIALSCLLTGCVSQRYLGVQISSTDQMSFTRVLVNGNAVVVCEVTEKKSPPGAAGESTAEGSRLKI